MALGVLRQRTVAPPLGSTLDDDAAGMAGMFSQARFEN
jgi:hypothetical protein